jgi:hypothetical protein
LAFKKNEGCKPIPLGLNKRLLCSAKTEKGKDVLGVLNVNQKRTGLFLIGRPYLGLRGLKKEGNGVKPK